MLNQAQKERGENQEKQADQHNLEYVKKEVEAEFDTWIEQKKYLHFRNRNPGIRNGEVWWCGVGKNVGVEINGKGAVFTRPVIIYKALGKNSFLGIPLTSQQKFGPWYALLEFKNRVQYAALCSARVMSRSRLYRKYGELSNMDYAKVIEAFKSLFVDETRRILAEKIKTQNSF